MATFALIHGAGDGGWYWHLVAAELRERGHDVVAPDLPEDESAGLPAYADVVVEAIGDLADPVVVAQSFGAFTGPLVCDRVEARLLWQKAGGNAVGRKRLAQELSVFARHDAKK